MLPVDVTVHLQYLLWISSNILRFTGNSVLNRPITRIFVNIHYLFTVYVCMYVYITLQFTCQYLHLEMCLPCSSAFDISVELAHV